MPLDNETILNIATLARIKIPENALPALSVELNRIFGWMEQLSEVDTNDIEPMTSVVDSVSPQREDIVTEGGTPEKLLANAPQSDGSFYAVPKVVE